MPSLGNTLPFGLRDVKVYPVDANGTRIAASGVDLPVSKTFSFKETTSSTDLVGDDVIQGSHEFSPMVDWELEAGGYSFEALAIIAGGTVTTTGTTPATVKRYSKRNTDARPYFEVEGQAISDSGGDMHAIIYRCKCTGDVDGKFENGNFAVTKCTGKGYGRLSDGLLYEFVQNETTAPIVTA